MDVLYSDEAIDEINNLLNQRQNYVNPKGGLVTGSDVDTISLVLKNMTGE